MDDQPSNVRLLEHTLRRAGYVEVSSTVEPQEVAALHLEHRFDLIVLDLQMPKMDGFEVIARLHEVGEADWPAILVMSADSAQSRAALEAGATSFLGKPFKLPDVVERIQILLDAASAT